MTTSLVLHLGDHKTGSTSIQNVLSSGQFTSRKAKILFPLLQKGKLHHNDIVRTLIRPKLIDARKRQFAALGEKIRAAKADIAVLSAENFEYVKPKVLRRTLEEAMPELVDQARLLVYVRPHADRLISSYAERIKQGLFMGSLEEFFEESREEGEFFYAARLNHWEEVFPGQLSVRPMLRDVLHQGDVVSDFFHFVLQGRGFKLKAKPVTNEKLCIEDLSVLLELQRAVSHITGLEGAPREPVRSLGWRVGRMLAAARAGGDAGDAGEAPNPGTPLALDAALAARVAECYAADAAEMDRAFFTGTPLGDRLDAVRSQAPGQVPPVGLEHHYDAETVAMIRAWLDLITRLYEVDPAGWRPYFQRAPLIIPPAHT